MDNLQSNQHMNTPSWKRIFAFLFLLVSLNAVANYEFQTIYERVALKAYAGIRSNDLDAMIECMKPYTSNAFDNNKKQDFYSQILANSLPFVVFLTKILILLFISFKLEKYFKNNSK